MPQVTIDQAEAPLVLSIDAGTSSVRALIFDRHGHAVEQSEMQLEYRVTTSADGGVEFDAESLLAMAMECVDGAIQRIGPRSMDLRAVGISCFWHSLVGLDRNGMAVTPIYYYSDTRSRDDADALRAELDAGAVHERTGCEIHSSYWPAKLRWLNRTDPSRFERVARWCSFADLMFRHTHGLDATSVSMASGTGMLDVSTMVWDRQLIEAIGLSDRSLPEIVDQHLPVEWALPPYQRRWPDLKAAPWFPAVGDGACANVGAGATGPNRIALTVGTTGAMRMVLPAPGGAPPPRAPGLWTYRLDRNNVVVGAAITNGGKLLEWINDLLHTTHGGPESVAAAAMAPDTHGLTFLPFLSGERSPIWNDRATGVIAGLTLATGRAALERAATEAIGLRFARLYPSVLEVAAEDHQIVTSGGAMLRNPLLLQITADALGHPLRTLPPEEESSARGAALMALSGIGAIDNFTDSADPLDRAGTIAPNHAHLETYRRAVVRQERLERLLFPDGGAWTDSV